MKITHGGLEGKVELSAAVNVKDAQILWLIAC